MSILRTTSLKKNFFIGMVCISLSMTHGVSLADDESNTKSSTALAGLKELRDRTSELTINAMSLLGIKYKRGGNSAENGLDCSGFVRLVFKNTDDTVLPRTAKEISTKGAVVDTKDLQPGDLVFYNTLKKSFSHVGIYLGDNKFIHSPSAGGRVRIESINIGYWKKRFSGARRIVENNTDTSSTATGEK